VTPLRTLLALLALSIAPATAAASDDVGFGREQPSWAVGFGPVATIGGMEGVDPGGGGLHLEVLGRLFPEAMAGAEADYTLIGGNAPELDHQVAGRSVRAGAKLRWSVFGWGPRDLGGELALTGGIGYEQIDWNHGGQLHRTQFMMGIEDGLAATRRIDGKLRYGGLAFGARVLLSRATPDCSAGCPMEVDTGWNTTILFDLILRAGM